MGRRGAFTRSLSTSMNVVHGQDGGGKKKEEKNPQSSTPTGAGRSSANI
jgi:hypothetical protein